MNMTKTALAIALGVATAHAFAATYYLTSPSAPMNETSSYRLENPTTGEAPTALPGSSDDVWLPNGTIDLGTYDPDATEPTAFSVFANVHAIYFSQGYRIKVNVAVNAGDTATVNSAVTPEANALISGATSPGTHNYNSLTFVKTGAGALAMNPPDFKVSWRNENSGWTCQCSYDILAGSVELLNPNVYAGRINVSAADTTFIVGRNATGTFSFYPRCLAGAGVITNCHATCSCNLNEMRTRTDDTSTFSGKIAGTFGAMAISGPQHFANGTSDFTGYAEFYASGAWGYGTTGYGTTWIDQFGAKGQPSSIGAGSIVRITSNGGAVIYTGSGETTDKSIYLYDTTKHYPAIIDAGATGGITFTGDWYGGGSYKTDSGYKCIYNARVLLTGSNTAPCRVLGKVYSWNESGNSPSGKNTHNFCKRGTGTWSFENAESTAAGTFEVQEGKLQYTSLAPKGITCALGLATNLEEYVDISSSTGKTEADYHPKAAYALAVGKSGSSDVASLEYTGSGVGFSEDRPIVISGTAEIGNAGTGRLILGGLSNRTDGATSTLVLAAAEASVTNDLSNVDSGSGTINLVKTGAGAWHLKGDLALGSLAVNGGTLILDHNVKYRWYRFTAQALAVPGANGNPHVHALSLYDADGVRQNLEMEYYYPNGSRLPSSMGSSKNLYSPRVVMSPLTTGQYYCDLQPNEIAYGFTTATAINYYLGGSGVDIRDVVCTVIDTVDSTTVPETGFTYATGMYVTRVGGKNFQPKASDPTTWAPIVMRVKDDAPAIVAYDFARYGGNNETDHSRDIGQFEMEASIDGIHWQTLHAYTNSTGVSQFEDKQNTFWYAHPTETYVRGKSSPRPGKGFALTGTVPNEVTYTSLALAGGTIAVNGDPITVSGLTLDATKGGALKNVTYADSGTIDLTNVGNAADITVPCDLTGLDAANWTINLPEGAKNRIVTFENGKIRIVKRGLVMIIR